MSRNADKIRKALEVKGWEAEEIFWEPIGSAPIMCGPEGGWYVGCYSEALNKYETILGYNIQEVLEEIEKLPEVQS